MLRRKTLTDLSSVTFSQGLEDGHAHYDWLDGRKISPSGRDLVLASHSVLPGKVKALMTPAISGPLFVGSSPSENLQLSLESKLRQKLDVNGSPEYVLTWKQWPMKWGPQICALRASVRPMLGKDSGGWPTPKVQTGKYQYSNGDHNKPVLNLEGTVELVGWRTPCDRDHHPSKIDGNNTRNDMQIQLAHQVHSVGWLTPNTPRAHEADPSTGDPNHNRNQKGPEHLGQIPNGMNAETASKEGYRLNPRFSLWLMGFPVEWAFCGERGMQSSRK